MPHTRDSETTARRSQMFSQLPPSMRRVCAALMTGRSEKQIAADLKLSPHTVHSHVKALYKWFRVHSRAELMAKLLR